MLIVGTSAFTKGSLVPRPPFIACSMKSGKAAFFPPFHTASDKSLGRPGYEATPKVQSNLHNISTNVAFFFVVYKPTVIHVSTNVAFFFVMYYSLFDCLEPPLLDAELHTTYYGLAISIVSQLLSCALPSTTHTCDGSNCNVFACKFVSDGISGTIEHLFVVNVIR